MLITWKDVTQFENLGRNGYSKARGVYVAAISGEIHIEGVNSTGNVTQMRLVVPLSAVDVLISSLQQEQALVGARLVYSYANNVPPGEELRDTDDAILPGGRRVPWIVGGDQPHAVRVRALEPKASTVTAPAET